MKLIAILAVITALGAMSAYGILNTGRKRYDTLYLQTDSQKMKSDMDFMIATLLLLIAILAVPFLLFLIAYFFL